MATPIHYTQFNKESIKFAIEDSLLVNISGKQIIIIMVPLVSPDDRHWSEDCVRNLVKSMYPKYQVESATIFAEDEEAPTFMRTYKICIAANYDIIDLCKHDIQQKIRDYFILHISDFITDNVKYVKLPDGDYALISHSNNEVKSLTINIRNSLGPMYYKNQEYVSRLKRYCLKQVTYYNKKLKTINPKLILKYTDNNISIVIRFKFIG